MKSDREFIDAAAQGLALEAEPFTALSRELEMSEDEVIERLRRLIGEGKVRRFAASVRHQPMGYTYNAMVIARTDERHLDEVGEAASGLPAVSHCYHRHHPDGDRFCVYIMVHGIEEKTVEETVEKIQRLSGVRALEVCSSTAELKKTSLSGVSTDLNSL